jgi:ABC-2 type transport system ATP-binding protein
VVEIAISTESLVKDYGPTRGLDGLDLEVRAGEVVGFLGPNGAGKTTTIRILLDLIRPTAGRASVLGSDPRAGGAALRRRIGYLGGDFLVDGRQTARELLTYLANLRGGVREERMEELSGRLDLDLDRQIRTLSRGNRQKVGVVQAFMHEPELLILDEPTSGLDPFLQREFESMARAAVGEGRTVFMSSHVMSEVQRTADRVGIIRNGRLAAVEDVENLRRRARRHVEIVFSTPPDPAEFERIEGLSDVEIAGSMLTCRLDGSPDPLLRALSTRNVLTFTAEEPDLDELFFDRYDDRSHDAP